MTTFFDAPADDLIEAVADKLAEESAIEAPDWASVAKTGIGRELPPEQSDFWERRSASILRKVAIDEPVGVGSLRTAYGSATQGSTRYRVRPRRNSDGSGSIVRTILQQLEEAGYVETAEGEGRVVTGAGRSLLDETAVEVIEASDVAGLERYA